MTFRRLAAIAIIFLSASLCWSVLGSSLVARTGQFDARLEQDVRLLWGGAHRQVAPHAWILRPGTDTEVVETKSQDGGIVRQEVSKPVVRSVPAALSRHGQRSISSSSTGAKDSSGTRPTASSSRQPTPS